MACPVPFLQLKSKEEPVGLNTCYLLQGFSSSELPCQFQSGPSATCRRLSVAASIQGAAKSSCLAAFEHLEQGIERPVALRGVGHLKFLLQKDIFNYLGPCVGT